MTSLSHVRLFATPWTVAYQAPPSMGFFWQEYWTGFPFPSPEDLPDPGIEPRSLTLQADVLSSEPPELSILIVTTIVTIDRKSVPTRHCTFQILESDWTLALSFSIPY